MLLAEEFLSEVVLDASVGDEDTALAVFGTGAGMNADSCTSRHVTNERHKTAEAWGPVSYTHLTLPTILLV